MVTKKLLRECLYDSNCEIRNYAQKRIKDLQVKSVEGKKVQ